jgi:hypothetical protein
VAAVPKDSRVRAEKRMVVDLRTLVGASKLVEVLTDIDKR